MATSAARLAAGERKSLNAKALPPSPSEKTELIAMFGRVDDRDLLEKDILPYLLRTMADEDENPAVRVHAKDMRGILMRRLETQTAPPETGAARLALSGDSLNGESAARITDRVLWLAVKMIDEANRVKGRIKVGGHQAASASSVHLMTALELLARHSHDHIAHKPHAAPVYHAIQYLLGNLPESALYRLRENSIDPAPLTTPDELKGKISDDDLQRFTGLMTSLRDSLPRSAKMDTGEEGLHSYPGMADPDGVTVPTGSVGLGPAAVIGLAIAQKWLKTNGYAVPDSRYFAVVGDGEVSEGNLLEMLPLAGEYRLGNVVHLIDFNRLSLDGVMPENTLDWIRGQYRTAGWRVIELKWGNKIRKVFDRKDSSGGIAFYTLMRSLPQKEYELLTGKSGAEIRAALLERRPDLRDFLAVYPDRELYEIFTDLGGHDIPAILEALNEALKPSAPGAPNDKPTVIIAYTHKGHHLPSLMGNPKNHSMLLGPDEMEALRKDLRIPDGADFPGLLPESPEGAWIRGVRERLDRERASDETLRRNNLRSNDAEAEELPDRFVPDALPSRSLSTQVYFSQLTQMMQAIAAADPATLSDYKRSLLPAAARYLTVSPDVATSTVHLGGIPGDADPASLRGQRHFRLGIAEMSAVTLAAALGKAGEFWGTTLLPVVIVYDMFLFRRAFDPVFYAQYWNSRMLIVGEPSGSSLSPEGAQHQSFVEPLISRALPNVITWEPAYPVELSFIEADRVKRVLRGEDKGRGVVYYRLSTLPIEQSGLVENLSAQTGYRGLAEPEILQKWGEEVLEGGYRLVDYRGADGYKPDENVVNLMTAGAQVQEALIASRHLKEAGIFANVIVVSSVDLILGRLARETNYARLRKLIPENERAFTPLVTVADASPEYLAGAAGVLGLGLGERNLGIDRQGRSTRDPEKLYRHHGIDRQSIAHAAFTALADRDYGRGPAQHFVNAFAPKSSGDASEPSAARLAGGDQQGSMKGKSRKGVSKWELLEQFNKGLENLPEGVVAELVRESSLGAQRRILIAAGLEVAGDIDGKFLTGGLKRFLNNRQTASPAEDLRRHHLRHEGVGRHLIAYSADDFDFVLKMPRDPNKSGWISKAWIGKGYRLAEERLNGLAVYLGGQSLSSE